MPCPNCNKFIKLEVENLKENGYHCQECSFLIDDKIHKTQMLMDGNWETEDPESNRYGFHLSQLYAPFAWVKWRDIYQQLQESKNKTEEEKTFSNLVLAETWEEKGSCLLYTSPSPRDS